MSEEEALDIEELDWKIKVEFPVQNLDTPIERAAAAIRLYQARMISRERALKMIDAEDEIEKMRLSSDRRKK